MLCRRACDGKELQDKNGSSYWFYPPESANGSYSPKLPSELAPVSRPETAPIDQRDRFYRELLSHLDLSASHRADLQRRGFTGSEIEALGVRSFTRFTDIHRLHLVGLAENLAAAFPWWPSVPGLVADKEGQPRLTGYSGLFIPCRDLQGRIQGLRLRHDDDAVQNGKVASRYSWFSGKQGATCGSPCSFWPGTAADLSAVRVTEGELKAAFAAYRTGVPTIAAAGVNQLASRQVIEWLGELAVPTVLLTPDQDYRTNRHVAADVRKATVRLAAAQFTVKMETWAVNEQLVPGKIDDALLASAQIVQIDPAEYLAAAAAPIQTNAPANGTRPLKDEWQTPVPIESGGARPPFPVAALPSTLAKYVGEVAVAYQVPEDLVALSVLSVLGCALQKRVDIDTGRGSVFPLNIWTLSIYPSGGGKSRVLSEVSYPLEDWEERLQARATAQNEAEKEERDMTEQRISQLQRLKSRTEEEETELRRATAKLRDTAERPLPAVYCADLTSESLESALRENEGRIGIFNAEASDFFQVMAGRYAKDGQSSFGNFLSAYSQENIRTRRVIRGTSNIHKPTLTMGVAIQPSVFERIAANRDFVTRGLPARFLISYPPDLRGRRDVDPPPINTSTRAAYNELVRTLTHIEPSKDHNGHLQPFRIELQRTARQAFLEFARWAESSMGPDGMFSEVGKEFAARLREHLAKVVGILHCAQHPEEPTAYCVPEETVLAGAGIVRWSADHVLSTIGMGASVALNSRAAYLCERIAAQEEWKASGAFGLRDLFQIVKRKEAYRTGGTKALEEDVSYLEDLGYVKRLDNHPKSRAKLYRVNPLLFSKTGPQCPHNLENPDAVWLKCGDLPCPHLVPSDHSQRSGPAPVGTLGTSGDMIGPHSKPLLHMAEVGSGDIGDLQGTFSHSDPLFGLSTPDGQRVLDGFL